MTQKIVINTCFGGFSISQQAVEYMITLGSEHAKQDLAESQEYAKKRDDDDEYDGNIQFFYGHTIGHDGYDRTDPLLIAAVEYLKDKANSAYSKLKVVEIPYGVEWEILDYDGVEMIHEKHRVWG